MKNATSARLIVSKQLCVDGRSDYFLNKCSSAVSKQLLCLVAKLHPTRSAVWFKWVKNMAWIVPRWSVAPMIKNLIPARVHSPDLWAMRLKDHTADQWLFCPDVELETDVRHLRRFQSGVKSHNACSPWLLQRCQNRPFILALKTSRACFASKMGPAANCRPALASARSYVLITGHLSLTTKLN